MSTIFLIWPLLSWWTTVLPRQLCKKMFAVLPPLTPPAPPPPPPPPLLLLQCGCCCCCVAAELLLCCCCWHIRVPLLRVPKKILRMMLCFAMSTDLSFFRYEICLFWDLMEFRRFVANSQSDAGMNLAFFKFDGIIGSIILSQTL